jgi:hypothetical protein
MRFSIIAAVLTLVVAQVSAQGFIEDFEAGVPPAGWTVTDPAGMGMIWQVNTVFAEPNYTGASGDCAMCDADWYGSGLNLDTELITHTFVVPGNAVLDYDMAYSDLLTGHDFADTDIDVGAGWVTLQSLDADFYGPQHVTLDLSGYAGMTAQLRFHYYDITSTGWDWYWQVDHVVLSGDATPVEAASWSTIKSMYR